MSKDQSISWSGEPPANHSVSQDSGVDLKINEEISHSLIAGWLTDYVLDGLSGKMSPVSCPVTEEGTFLPLSQRWQNSGIASPGECWTLKTSESPKDAEECLLSDVLQEIGEILPRYYLSSRAATGILRRAEKRGRELPTTLEEALRLTCNESHSTGGGE